MMKETDDNEFVLSDQEYLKLLSAIVLKFGHTGTAIKLYGSLGGNQYACYCRYCDQEMILHHQFGTPSMLVWLGLPIYYKQVIFKKENFEILLMRPNAINKILLCNRLTNFM